MSELSGWEDAVGPFFEVVESHIISRTDNSALVDSADQLNNNLLGSVVIDDLELSDIAIGLHNPKELDDELRDGSDEDLLFSFSLSVDDCPETIGEDVHFHHSIIN